MCLCRDAAMPLILAACVPHQTDHTIGPGNVSSNITMYGLILISVSSDKDISLNVILAFLL